MGDRIFQGFRLSTDSFAEALRIVEAFRPWVQAQAEQQLDTFMAKVMEERGFDAVEAFDLWQANRERSRVDRRSRPAVDTDFTVVLIPVGGVLLGQVFTGQRAWLAEWSKSPGVAEYSYWDNLEKPEEVSEQDWAARAIAWAQLGPAPVATQGFSIELVSPDGPMPKDWRRS